MIEPNLPEQGETKAAPQKTAENPLAIKTPKTIANSLTRAELIDALNSEIEQIENENKRPGWSSWALQGGIATFIWLALADFSPKSNLQTIGIVFLFGSFLGEFLLSVCQSINGLGKFESTQLRYRFLRDDPNTTPAFIIFTLVRFSGFLIIYFLLDPIFHVPTFIWFCGMGVAMCIVALPVRFMKTLLPNKKIPSKSQTSVTWLIIVWSGFLSYEFFEKLPFSEATYKVADFRVGFLLTGVVYLFLLLITGEKERPIVNKLKTIRRELAFGHISVEEATKDADIALSGLTTSDAIEHKIAEVLKEFQNVTLCFENLIAECKTADFALKNLETATNLHENKWIEDARKVAIIIDSCEVKRIASQQLFNASFYKAKSFLRSIESLQTTDPVSKPELASKWENLRKKTDKMFELSKSTTPLLEDIKARYIAVSFADNPLQP